MTALSLIRCPNPEHDDTNPSCAIYSDGGYCFSRCGFLSVQQLTEWLGHDYLRQVSTYSQNRDRADTTSRVDPWKYVLQCHRTLSRGARQSRTAWFIARGFTPYSIERFKFGHTGDRFCIPLWNDGECFGYKLRRDDDYCFLDEPKYLNMKGLPSGIVRPNPAGTPTVVLEGELDTYLLSQWGVDAITTTTGVGSKHHDIFSVYRGQRSSRERYLLFDADEAGEAAAQAFSKLDPAIRRLTLPAGSDITDYLAGVDPEQRGRTLLGLFRGG